MTDLATIVKQAPDGALWFEQPVDWLDPEDTEEVLLALLSAGVPMGSIWIQYRGGPWSGGKSVVYH